MRDRASQLAGEISRDLPDLTVHDVTHLDALWEMADLIVGAQHALTPAEAFVFGAEALLHDLAMSVASIPDGEMSIATDSNWDDIIVLEFLKLHGRRPQPNEIAQPSEDVRKAAVQRLLRKRHAAHAERLATDAWHCQSGEQFFLIDDSDLRQAFGRSIGRIAHSHWWSTTRLDSEFARPLGAPHWAPANWTLDLLKLACAVRVADAAHIDARRAPPFLRAIRRPVELSDAHWSFQSKLQKPQIAADSLVYTSGSPFLLRDTSAWWLAYDTLRMIDRELRDVDTLLADRALQRFAARRIAGADSPERMVSYLPTSGWEPIDASIRVSDVPHLIQTLGGQDLYGDDPSAALRELLQNSCDAIRARRVLECRGDQWGAVRVALGADGDKHWLEVVDCGIGMSRSVLSRQLLDFGSTYWGSEAMLDDFPGVIGKGFTPTGKYGIGFFAVFMLGHVVTVRSRRCDAAQTDTSVLEFSAGALERPLVRDALPSERLIDGGTIVRVFLERKPTAFGGLLDLGRGRVVSLPELCAYLCPAVDVAIICCLADREDHTVGASDWLMMPGQDLLARTHFDPNDRHDIRSLEVLPLLADNLREICASDGSVVGRAAVSAGARWTGYNSVERVRGVVTVGGLRAGRLWGIAGILAGTPTRAARDLAVPNISDMELARWADEQAKLVPHAYPEPSGQMYCASIIWRCGAATQDLPICWFRGRWLTYDELCDTEKLDDPLIAIEPEEYLRVGLRAEQLLPNIILTETFGLSMVNSLSNTGGVKWPRSSTAYSWDTSLAVLVLAAASVAWQRNEPTSKGFLEQSRHAVIGHIGSQGVSANARVLHTMSVPGEP